MRNPLSPIFGSIRTKFEITKRQGKRVGGRIGAHSVVCHLLPAVRGQTDIGVMRARARNARTSRVPTKNEQCAVDGSRPFERTGTVFRLCSGHIPGGFMPVIVTECVTHVFVDFDFMKTGRVLRPTHRPLRHWRDISLMRAIPGFASNFDNRQPAENEQKAGSRKQELGTLTYDLRLPTSDL